MEREEMPDGLTPLERAWREVSHTRGGFVAGFFAVPFCYEFAQAESHAGPYAWLQYVYIGLAAAGVYAVMHYGPAWWRAQKAYCALLERENAAIAAQRAAERKAKHGNRN